MRTAKAGGPSAQPRSATLPASAPLAASSSHAAAAPWLSQAAAQASTERDTPVCRPATRATRCHAPVALNPSTGSGWTGWTAVAIIGSGRTVSPSMTLAQAASFNSSMESIGRPRDATPALASAAAWAVANAATTVASFRGVGTILNVTSAMTPSVPSPPTWSRSMAKPVTFFTTLPPLLTTVPSGRTARMPMTISRGRPKPVPSGPAIPAASVPPTVARPGRGGSSGSHCDSRVNASCSAPTAHPACTVTVRSAGSWATTRFSPRMSRARW